jgi:hypothetical protein
MEYKVTYDHKNTDSKVDMKDMAAVFSKGDDDGFTDVLVGPKRLA